MPTISEIFNSSELAFASYSDLLANVSIASQITALEQGGMSLTQATEFAKRYTKVIAVIDDSPDTGFAATVFESSDGQLTMAIRGTDDLFGSDGDDDLDIFSKGIASEQIIAMVNWWNRTTTEAGTSVAQLTITSYVNAASSVPGAVSLYSVPNGNNTVTNYYLEPTANVAATGELYGRADQALSITGHSLGGHLAMAFGSLFPSATQSVTVFNAPGFAVNTFSQNLFQALGGVVPSGQLTTNVVADESSTGSAPWSAVAGLHNRPGAKVDISIENQLSLNEPDSAVALNHSQMILTDSLAVYNLLSQLDDSLSETGFDAIFQLASNEEYKTLERIVDSLFSLLGAGSSALPTGNDQREALYQAIYSIQNNVTFQALMAGDVTVSAGANATEARSNFGAFLSLLNLSPLVIQPNNSAAQLALENVYSELASTWQKDQNLPDNERTYTDQYLTDRAQMLELLITRNTADITTSDSLDVNLDDALYIDQETNLKLTTGGISLVGVTQIIGSFKERKLAGDLFSRSIAA